MPVIQTGFSIYAAPNPLVSLIQPSPSWTGTSPSAFFPLQPRYSLFLQPHYLTAIYQLAEMYSWSNLIYLYDSGQGLQKLQFLLSLLNDAKDLANPKNNANLDEKPQQRMQLKALKRIKDGRQGYEFIRQFEMQDKESTKHVILDCELPLVRQLIIDHVNDIYMGRRNFHFLLSTLVFDHIVQFASQTPEYFALNITGIRLLDPEFFTTISALKQPENSFNDSIISNNLLKQQLNSWVDTVRERSNREISSNLTHTNRSSSFKHLSVSQDEIDHFQITKHLFLLFPGEFCFDV